MASERVGVAQQTLTPELWRPEREPASHAGEPARLAFD